jgi:hypothetical protein
MSPVYCLGLSSTYPSGYEKVVILILDLIKNLLNYFQVGIVL